MLSRSNAAAPSFVLIRRAAGYRVAEQAALLIGNLPAVQAELEIGSIVVFGERAVRIRRLPISDSAFVLIEGWQRPVSPRGAL